MKEEGGRMRDEIGFLLDVRSPFIIASSKEFVGEFGVG